MMEKTAIEELYQSLLADMAKLAADLFGQFAKEALADGKLFLEQSKERLQQWTEALASGKLDAEEFESLLKGQQDLLRMKAIKQAGISQITIDQFKQGLLALITASVAKFLRV